MSNTEMAYAASLSEAVEKLAISPHWTLLSHEQPDGDTLGCGSALYALGMRLEKTVLWAGPDSLPEAYAFLPFSERYETLGELQAPEGSLVVFLDTTNPGRTIPVKDLSSFFAINIDHHGDNSRFAHINLVDPKAGATAEVVWEIMSRLGGPVSKEEAIALYTGLVTDTGRFMYSCTTPRSHLMASDLLEKGVLPELMDLLLYCNVSPQALRLRGRAFSRLDFDPEKGIALTWLSKSDFKETGADYSETEGLSSDLLRVRGSQFSALLVENDAHVRVSLRSRGKIPASEIAHKHGGGGHPNAAGMKLPLPLEGAFQRFREEIREAHV
jgi:phosphoesterase RecJ-like protein